MSKRVTMKEKARETKVVTWKEQPELRERIKAASDSLMKRNAEAYKILADR